jgi:CspA family cold shock protein
MYRCPPNNYIVYEQFTNTIICNRRLIRSAVNERDIEMENSVKYQGVVVWFDARKGYGFVKKNDGSGDVFIHYTNILTDGFKTLEPQQKVEYEIGKNHMGDQCINLRIIDDQV